MTTMSSGGYPTPPCFQTEVKCLTICCLLLGDFCFYFSCLALQFCFMARKIKSHGSSVFCSSCCFVLMMEKSHKEIQLFLLCVCVCKYFVVVVVCVCWGRHFSVLLTNKKISTLNLV